MENFPYFKYERLKRETSLVCLPVALSVRMQCITAIGHCTFARFVSIKHPCFLDSHSSGLVLWWPFTCQASEWVGGWPRWICSRGWMGRQATRDVAVLIHSIAGPIGPTNDDWTTLELSNSANFIHNTLAQNSSTKTEASTRTLFFFSSNKSIETGQSVCVCARATIGSMLFHHAKLEGTMKINFAQPIAIAVECFSLESSTEK